MHVEIRYQLFLLKVSIGLLLVTLGLALDLGLALGLGFTAASVPLIHKPALGENGDPEVGGFSPRNLACLLNIVENNEVETEIGSMTIGFIKIK